MKQSGRFTDLARVVFFFSENRISLAGLVLTTASAITLAWFWVLELMSPHPMHPYTGILFFLILPGFFFAGLGLIPLGMWFRRRKLRRKGEIPGEFPQVDLGSSAIRKGLFIVVGATALNILILGTASFKGVEYMDSTQFCGQACHSVMSPELTAYKDGAHSRVTCTQCHIGPGAGWFVKSKISGTRQLIAVSLKTYSRPIPSPVEHLRPARETCEQCHWPQKFHGDKMVVRTKYAEDEGNTATTTVLLLKIGGRTWQGQAGIHGRHLDDGERITYVAADSRRQTIAKITYKDDKGQLVDYLADDNKLTPDELAKLPSRPMDCVDCHNRPAHTFEMPSPALDKAINSQHISRELPFIKKKAMEVLKVDYPTQEAAVAQIPATLTTFYRTSYPEIYAQKKQLVEAAANAVKEIYLRNVFPQMKITWGTYPNHIGHQDSAGCFRCHDGTHNTKDGKMIAADCDTCHTILAQDEKDPKILKDLQIK
ncbi:MAG: NapC/NirT family cytochrome c [Holophaga sp.]|nr:NapC/NirT family cytochrome c [Holophaga sp.]